MAEPRRVPLLSVQSSHSSEHLASAQNKTNANGEASGEKADEEKLKSFRFEISLSTSNEKHCPEYSYVDLVKVKQVRFFIYFSFMTFYSEVQGLIVHVS